VTLRHLILLAFLAMSTTLAVAQDAPRPTFQDAVQTLDQRLKAAIEELNAVRSQAVAEKLPLSRELSRIESELLEQRSQFQSTSRLLDTRTLDLANLRTEIKNRETEATYLTNLLSEFARKFETRLHIAEVARYKGVIEAASLAMDNSALSSEQVYDAQLDVLEASLGRLQESLGGTRFDGTAVNSTGDVLPGTFTLLGPATLFLAKDGKTVGTAEQVLGSFEPAVVAFTLQAEATAAKQLVEKGTGFFPLDPTLGNAHKIETTEDTLVEHILKGGPVMYPIFLLAGLALLVVLWKALEFVLVRNPSRARIKAVFEAMAKQDDKKLGELTKALHKPDFLREWMTGAVVGALAGLLVGWFVIGEFKDPLFIDIQRVLSSFSNLGESLWTYAIAYAVLGALIELALRFVFGWSPTARMLQVGVEHIGEPTELVEEVMYEQMLDTRLRLERLLPFVAVSAAAAPLLGLLGTVTGIINTFNLITVYGSGDVKTLSSGISEALITTEYGLIVAIPSLLIHGFLSRRARGIASDMEQAAVAFMNALAKSPYSQNAVIAGSTTGTEIPLVGSESASVGAGK